jgi:hypothetical protein
MKHIFMLILLVVSLVLGIIILMSGVTELSKKEEQIIFLQ